MPGRRARRFRVYILEQQGRQQSKLGKVKEDWQRVTYTDANEQTQEVTRWCEIVPRGRLVKGGEVFTGAAVEGETAQTFEMGYWADKDGKMLSSQQKLEGVDGPLKGRVFNILNVANEGELRGTTKMTAYCVEAGT